MLGVWMAVVSEPGESPQELSDDHLFVFSERVFDFYDLVPKGNVRWTSSGMAYRLVSNTLPQQIEIEKFDPESRKKVQQLCIVRFVGDDLIDWCAGEFGSGKRPESFHSDTANGVYCIQLKRVAASIEEFEKKTK